MTFTAHNIRLDDGTQTLPSVGSTMEQHPIFISTRKVLELIYPEGLENKSIAFVLANVESESRKIHNLSDSGRDMRVQEHRLITRAPNLLEKPPGFVQMVQEAVDKEDVEFIMMGDIFRVIAEELQVR